MPTILDSTALHSTKEFKHEFLVAGGLNLVCRVLRKDFFPNEVNYEIRQWCTLIALQLVRFLLCGEVEDAPSSIASKTQVTPSKLQNTNTKIASTRFSPTRPASSLQMQNSPIKLQQTHVVSSPLKDIASETQVAIQVLQTLGESEFLEMIACFVRICWAAAAGKLFLASASACPMFSKEYTNDQDSMGFSNGNISASNLNPAGIRSRQSSSGSTSSTSSIGDLEVTGLYFGICASQNHVSIKDTLIACEAYVFKIISFSSIMF